MGSPNEEGNVVLGPPKNPDHEDVAADNLLTFLGFCGKGGSFERLTRRFDIIETADARSVLVCVIDS